MCASLPRRRRALASVNVVASRRDKSLNRLSTRSHEMPSASEIKHRSYRRPAIVFLLPLHCSGDREKPYIFPNHANALYLHARLHRITRQGLVRRVPRLREVQASPVVALAHRDNGCPADIIPQEFRSLALGREIPSRIGAPNFCPRSHSSC